MFLLVLPNAMDYKTELKKILKELTGDLGVDNDKLDNAVAYMIKQLDPNLPEYVRIKRAELDSGLISRIEKKKIREPFIGNPAHIKFLDKRLQKIFLNTGIVLMSNHPVSGKYYFVTPELKEYYTNSLDSIEKLKRRKWKEYVNKEKLPTEFGAKDVSIEPTYDENVFQFFYNGMPRDDSMSEDLQMMLDNAIIKYLGKNWSFKEFTMLPIDGKMASNVIKLSLKIK